MPIDRLAPLITRLGPVFMQIYGLTEALHPVTCLKHLEHRVGNPKLGSIGTLTSSCRIRIAGDAGDELPDGEVGEIMIQGPIAFDGYWHDAEATAESLKDGWVASGDLGYRDGDGYYWIVDRKKDVIISGGFNVYTQEVEHVLCEHPSVAECAVVGVPHAEWGEMVCAAVYLHDGRDSAEPEILGWCRRSLAGYKTPKSVLVFASPLPRNSAGKIVKKEIVRMIENVSKSGGVIS